MIYSRQTEGKIFADSKTKTEIAKELNITPVLHKIQEYIRKCLQHTKGSSGNTLPGILKRYRPIGRRNNGRPLKRLLDV